MDKKAIFINESFEGIGFPTDWKQCVAARELKRKKIA